VRRGATSRVDLATLSVTVEQDSTMSALVIRCRRMPIQDRWPHDPKGGNTTVEQVMPRQRTPGRQTPLSGDLPELVEAQRAGRYPSLPPSSISRYARFPPTPTITTGSTVLGLRVQVQNVTGPVHRGHTADAVVSSGSCPRSHATGRDTEVTFSASGVHQGRFRVTIGGLSLLLHRSRLRRPGTPSPVS